MEHIKVRVNDSNRTEVIQHANSIGYKDTYSLEVMEANNLFFNPFGSSPILWSNDKIFNEDDSYMLMSVEEFLTYKWEDLE